MGKTENFKTKDKIYHEQIDFTKKHSLFMKVKPSDFDFSRANHYYLLLKNNSDLSTILNLTVIMNNIRLELQDGIKQRVEIGNKESAEFCRFIKPNQKEMEIHLRLINMED